MLGEFGLVTVFTTPWTVLIFITIGILENIYLTMEDDKLKVWLQRMYWASEQNKFVPYRNMEEEMASLKLITEHA
ncbi:hypothetical protein VQ643_15640 [Pseudomonas sp. F1_0610]|uniref:hypothetical protein n=1 Tax=Pseudomonas sp. F1_0610 TaxID=3114284 RepID=UPI0039C094B1